MTVPTTVVPGRSGATVPVGFPKSPEGMLIGAFASTFCPFRYKPSHKAQIPPMKMRDLNSTRPVAKNVRIAASMSFAVMTGRLKAMMSKPPGAPSPTISFMNWPRFWQLAASRAFNFVEPGPPHADFAASTRCLLKSSVNVTMRSPAETLPASVVAVVIE